MLPADWQRGQATATLPPGATLMLYTDGLVERRNQSLDKGIEAAAVTMAERAGTIRTRSRTTSCRP